MKQVTQNYKTGKISLRDVEQPALKRGGVLVRTHYSAVSIGTEAMKVREAKLSYVGKARARPDQVKKVLAAVRQQGLAATYRKVMNKLDMLTPLGYSLSGEVIGIGPDVDEFYVGQRVACGGAGYANHAEVNFVPKNLVVPMPDNVSMKHAAFATVGAIALQGFRQGEMQLGETACVIGLGLLGQLMVQILRAAGIRVMGVDVIEERCKLSQRFGAAAALKPDDPSLLATLDRLTGGHGADCIFLTAGSSSNAPTELAVKLARDRGRVVDVGKTRLDLPWNDYYLKELDVRFSRSYGPGRYDTSYEEQGIDYPIGYVRWTEKRNIAAFLDLVASGHVEVEPIISSVRRYADADQTYADIANAPGEYLGIVFDYEIGERAPSAPVETSVRKVVIRSLATEKVRVGAIGAGNYAASMLFPHLHKNRNVELLAVATTTSLSAENAKQKFNFKHACTDYKEVLQSPDVDAVIIATRHSSHATLVAEALRSGKATYVEKPLALSFNELEKVRSASVESKNDRLMVGFNRRFSPMIRQVAHELEDKKIPLVLHYRVHAGRIEGGSWYLDAKEGSRFIGEAGHFFDVLSCLAKARPVAVTAACLRPDGATRDDLENIVATVEYDNGSIGTVAYLTQGGAKVPKEFLELLGGGVAVQLDNFESLVVFEQDRVRKTRAQLDKGQKDEMEAFVEAVRTGGPMPIPIYQLFDTTLTTLGAAESRRMSARVDLTQYWAPAY